METEILIRDKIEFKFMQKVMKCWDELGIKPSWFRLRKDPILYGIFEAHYGAWVSVESKLGKVRELWLDKGHDFGLCYDDLKLSWVDYPEGQLEKLEKLIGGDESVGRPVPSLTKFDTRPLRVAPLVELESDETPIPVSDPVSAPDPASIPKKDSAQEPTEPIEAEDLLTAAQKDGRMRWQVSEREIARGYRRAQQVLGLQRNEPIRSSQIAEARKILGNTIPSYATFNKVLGLNQFWLELVEEIELKYGTW